MIGIQGRLVVIEDKHKKKMMNDLQCFAKIQCFKTKQHFEIIIFSNFCPKQIVQIVDFQIVQWPNQYSPLHLNLVEF